MRPQVLLRFDTEDYVTPESNRALYDILTILEELRIPATFVLVGEKIEMLLQEGETEILELLQHHALGYHSYLHSFHPLAAEYLAGKSWSAGVAEFLRTEEPGHEAFVEVFDQPPICYTQPGADWVPQAYEALQQWEVPCFFTEEKNTLVDLNQRPFVLNGILTLAKKSTIADLTNLASVPQSLSDAQNQFANDYQQALATGQEEFLTLVCHPGRLITTGSQTWDQLNFAQGQNLPRQEWQVPPIKDNGQYEQDLTAFKKFLLYLQNNFEFDWITAQDLVDLYQNRIIHRDRMVNEPTLPPKARIHNQRRVLPMEQVRKLAKAFTQEISYYSLDDQHLSAIQAATILCEVIYLRATEGYFPDSVTIPQEIFFPEDVPEVILPTDLDRLGWSELVEGAKQVLSQVRKNATYPAIVQVSPGQWVPLETFIGGIAQAVVTMTDEEIPQDRVLLPHPRLKLRDYVKQADQVYWDWSIFPKGFQNGELLYFAELLSWTIKPI